VRLLDLQNHSGFAGKIKGAEMIAKGKFIKDWDKSQISTGYQRPNQFRVITWDMGRIQSWLLGKQPLTRTLLEKVIR
jgi:hypothetical protein